jgi:hypothetical protein
MAIIAKTLTDVIMKLSGDPATFLFLCLNQPAAHALKRRFRQFALRDVDESDHGPNNLFSSQLG